MAFPDPVLCHLSFSASDHLTSLSWGSLWIPPHNPGEASQVRILEWILSAKLFLPRKVMDSQVLKMRVWTWKGRHDSVWASQMLLVVKNPLARAGDVEMQVWSLGWEDPLEEGIAAHSSIVAWRIPRTENPWRPTVHGVTKGWTRLKRRGTHTHYSVYHIPQCFTSVNDIINHISSQLVDRGD